MKKMSDSPFLKLLKDTVGNTNFMTMQPGTSIRLMKKASGNSYFRLDSTAEMSSTAMIQYRTDMIIRLFMFGLSANKSSNKNSISRHHKAGQGDLT